MSYMNVLHKSQVNLSYKSKSRQNLNWAHFARAVQQPIVFSEHDRKLAAITSTKKSPDRLQKEIAVEYVKEKKSEWKISP